MRFSNIIKWLPAVAAGFIVLAISITAHPEELVVDLRGIWTGHVVRHVTQKGFVPYYSGLRLVIEEQNGTQFKGYLIEDIGRDETMTTFIGALDLNNEYLYVRLASGDVRIGQIAADQRILLFSADSNKDTVTVFRLRKSPPLQGN